MKNVFSLIVSIVLSALVIKQFISRKHIRSRKDDPSIPPAATSAF